MSNLDIRLSRLEAARLPLATVSATEQAKAQGALRRLLPDADLAGLLRDVDDSAGIGSVALDVLRVIARVRIEDDR